MNRLRFLPTIYRDTLYALRMMRQKPAFVTTSVVTLGLAIGGNTAMFSVIRAVLIQPLQYRDPDRLVRIVDGATPARFAELKVTARSFTEVGALVMGATKAVSRTASSGRVYQFHTCMARVDLESCSSRT